MIRTTISTLSLFVLAIIPTFANDAGNSKDAKNEVDDGLREEALWD